MSEKTSFLTKPDDAESDDVPASHREKQQRRVGHLMIMISCLVVSSYFFGARCISTANTLYNAATTPSDPVEVVLRGAPLIDTHNDFPIWVRAFYKNDIYQKNFTNTSDLYGMVDFPRLQQGGVRGQFWSVWTACPEDISPSLQNNYSTPIYYQSVHETLQQIDLVHRLTSRFPSNLSPASTSHDIWRQFHHSNHHTHSPFSPAPISSLLGVEGLHQIANSASILRLYHSLGVRYITLTHNCHNIYADSCCAPNPPVHNGLSAAGRDIVREMNRIGVMVDLSHVSVATMKDALNATIAPVIFSHSSAYAVTRHPRNVPDEVLWLVKANKGVVQVNFAPDFLNTKEPDKASLGDVADHAVHVGELIGWEHVGFGSDFDGISHGPVGLEDVSKYPDLIGELYRRGVGVKELKGVVGGNVLRVLRDVEDVAKSMSDVLPLQDKVSGVWEDSFLAESLGLGP